MDNFGEKRKNDEGRRFPWWIALLVIGFAVGVFVTLLVVPSRIETVTYMSSEGIELTATAIIQQATATQAAVFTAAASS